MSDPVSWLVIEPGWRVVDAEGKEVGKVEEVLGEEDIFSGLAVGTGLLGSPRLVPADDIAEITEGCVRLSLSADQVKRLAEHESRDQA